MPIGQFGLMRRIRFVVSMAFQPTSPAFGGESPNLYLYFEERSRERDRPDGAKGPRMGKLFDQRDRTRGLSV